MRSGHANAELLDEVTLRCTYPECAHETITEYDPRHLAPVMLRKLVWYWASCGGVSAWCPKCFPEHRTKRRRREIVRETTRLRKQAA